MTATITTSTEAARKLAVDMTVRDIHTGWTGTITEISDDRVPMVTVDCGNGRSMTVRAMFVERVTVEAETPGAPAETVSISFDCETCTRCNGLGRYAGGTCFLCGGQKAYLTREGRAARTAYDALIAERMSRPIEQITPGTRVFLPANGALGSTLQAASRVVAEIEREGNSHRITYTGGRTYYVTNGTPVRLGGESHRPVLAEIMRTVATTHPKGATITVR